MAIFYPSPDPVQPIRKVLPVTPGNDPPRNGPLGGSTGILASVALWAAAAIAPMPVQKTLNIVPLTLTYGQQPPPSGPLPGAGNSQVPNSTAILATPSTGEPRNLQPWQIRAAQIVVLTLKYGSQPTPIAPLTPPNVTATLAWNPTWSAQEEGPAASLIPPPVVNNPPPNTSPQIQWVAPVWGAQSEPDLAPLTLVYGQQPPMSGPLGGSADVANMTALLWPTLSWPAQEEPGTAPLIPPPVANNPPPYTPALQQILGTWYNEPVTIEWITLGAGFPPSGDQPPPNGPLGGATDVANVTALLWPQASWPAQSESDLAPLVPVPVINNPPPAPLPLAYQSPILWLAQSRPPIAPLTLVYGAQPAPGPAIASSDMLALLAAWSWPWWSAQSENDVAPIVPQLVPPPILQSLPLAQLSPWIPLPQRPVQVAPLTLVYGQQPIANGPLGGATDVATMTALLWPQLSWRAQSAQPMTWFALPTIVDGVFVCLPVFSATLAELPVFGGTITVLPFRSST